MLRALLVKTFADKVEVTLAGEHTADSHSRRSGILSVKQRCAVKRAMRSSPQLVGSQVHAKFENFSPSQRIPFDSRSQKAVARLVRKERKEIMAERVPGINHLNFEGAMNRLADSISLVKLLARHNDPADEFHMDEHQVVQVGYQFKDGVTFLTVTTPHLLNNLARADNCKFEVQGHIDSWAKEKFGEDTKDLQCGHHLSCKWCCFSQFCCFAFPPSLCLRAKHLPPGQTPPFQYLNFVNCFINI
jgi:hypothetical protein